MSEDFWIPLVVVALVSFTVIALVRTPARRRKRRRDKVAAQRLQDQQANTTVGTLIPYKEEDEITRQLREKTPLKPRQIETPAPEPRTRTTSHSGGGWDGGFDFDGD